MMLQAAALLFVLCSVHGFTLQASFDKDDEYFGNTRDDDKFSVSTLIERANINVGDNSSGLIINGDIAEPINHRNADPCVSNGCLWPKATDGNVYVPYRISNAYSRNERNTITQGLQSFAQSTCIRFFPLQRQRNFVDIQSRQGCFSSVGRRGGAQVLSLSRQGCVFRQVIQHELLHALGFDHEQTRSDRDRHVRILLQNVQPGTEFNFRKIQTNNLGTPYDYNSVMHYSRYAFSRNGQPTIVPIPNRNVRIGQATQMSPTDIRRVNILYRCNSRAVGRKPVPVARKLFS